MRLAVFLWFLMLLEELPSQRKSIQARSRVLFYTFTRKAPARFRRKRLAQHGHFQSILQRRVFHSKFSFLFPL